MSKMKNLPNLLTYLRLVLIPVFVVLLINPGQQMIYAAIAIFMFASLTDFVDGLVARQFDAVSDTGKLLDPVADKILVMAALVMLVSMKTTEFGDPWVQPWMVILILARETWVTGLRGVAASRGVVVPAGQAGKWKSFLQMVAIVFLFLHQQPLFFAGSHQVSAKFVGEVLLAFSILLSYWGAMDYTWCILIDPDEKAVKAAE